MRAEVQVWRAELEKTVGTVELNEAQWRLQVFGTATGLVNNEQKLQQEVAQMCAKLEMKQKEQEKKKGNEEERLNTMVRERVEEFGVLTCLGTAAGLVHIEQKLRYCSRRLPKCVQSLK